MKLTRQKAIWQKCKECSYDSNEKGTWKQQANACEITECALWEYRPVSQANIASNDDSVTVEALNHM